MHVSHIHARMINPLQPRVSNSTSKAIIVGLRPALEGFVVTMHEGACETGSPDSVAGGIWRTVRTSPSALWQQTPTDRFNHNYNMTFLISPHGCPYSPLKWRSSRSKREPFRVLLPLLRHVAPLSDGKLLPHNAVVKGRCARDAIPWTFHIEVFKCDQDNSDTITRIGDDSVELLDSC